METKYKIKTSAGEIECSTFSEAWAALGKAVTDTKDKEIRLDILRVTPSGDKHIGYGAYVFAKKICKKCSEFQESKPVKEKKTSSKPAQKKK